MPWITLHERFQQLHPGQPNELVEKEWQRLYDAYSESQRHYHTLQHLADIFLQLEQVKIHCKNLTVMAAAIFYHDIVYQPGAGDNEERSAVMATQALQQLGWKENDIREVAGFIRSTTSHQPDESVLNAEDLLLFLDLDLSILATDWDTYRQYAQNILREFGNNAMVKWGRRGFMQKFLQKEHIYHTAFFRNKSEARARENISREINELLA